jgi:murein L,D-transpeptidase YafK
MVKALVLLPLIAGLLAAAGYLGDRHLPRWLARDLGRVDRVRVQKSVRRMTLYSDGRPVAVYRVSLGQDPIGPKRREGDSRTPEGRYTLDWRNPHSRFFRSLHLSYPTPRERAHAQRLGVSTGGDIMIHGLPDGLGWLGPIHRLWDWTEGCIAVTNTEMWEIWQAVPDGAPIEVVP